MPLDPAARALLDQMAALNPPPLSSLSAEQARANSALAPLRTSWPPELAATEDRTVPGTGEAIPIRIYRPASTKPLPVVVYFHGGGWVIGSVASRDAVCQQIATRVPAVVVSVDYRLAPEDRFPAAADDALSATTWVADHAGEIGADPARLAVLGDSAGGNLAAVTALRARDGGGPAIAYQLLVYPATDSSMTTPSYQENADGYLLSADSMRWFWDLYLGPDGDRHHPWASPVDADHHGGLPPALVVTAEFDPLRDEGEEYARRLQQAGVPVRSSRYDGMIHGFFGMDLILDGATKVMDEVVMALQEALE